LESGQNEEDADSYHDKNQDESSYSRSYRAKGQQKKRGRKKKIKDGNENSTESDPELLNYDKFLKKVSKKGTRVHMNVRMFAVRTVVNGTKVLAQANPKMSMGPKGEEKVVDSSNQIQKYSKNKINEIRKAPQEAPKPQEIEEVPEIKKSTSSKRSTGNTLPRQQSEEFYNMEGYDIGRYNLRKRGAQKKYYDDDPEFDDEIDASTRRKPNFQYEEDFRQVPRNVNYNMNRRAAPEANYQSKTKRRKDEDEDYIEEDDAEDQDEYSDDKKAKESKKLMEAGNSYNSTNMSQMGYMQQNKMPNQFPMQNQFPNQMNPANNMMSMQGKMPQYPMMMPQTFPGGMVPAMTGMPHMMPTTNSMAYMMNAQNRNNAQGDPPKMMNFPGGMPAMAMPMQQPNMGYMMRMGNDQQMNNASPPPMQQFAKQPQKPASMNEQPMASMPQMQTMMPMMGMAQMNPMFFQQNPMMRQMPPQNMNRMFGQQNFPGNFPGMNNQGKFQ